MTRRILCDTKYDYNLSHCNGNHHRWERFACNRDNEHLKTLMNGIMDACELVNLLISPLCFVIQILFWSTLVFSFPCFGGDFEMFNMYICS